MAEDTNTSILAKCQTFLTEQKRKDVENPSQDMNTNLPNGTTIKFMQFCRAMGTGFKMECWDTIAGQTGAIQVSKDNNGRTEAKEVAIGLMGAKDRAKYGYGPVYRDVEEEPKKGKK